MSDVLSHVMGGFNRWVKAAPHITHTLIEDAGDIYVKDIAEHGGAYCVVLWKRDLAGSDAFGLRIDAPPGSDGAVKRHHFGSDYIPGHPFYFIVDTAEAKLLTLRPQFAIQAGREELEKAVRFYMKAHSSELRPDPSMDGDTTVVRLRMVDDKGESLEPSFGTSIRKADTALDDIVTHSGNIRKLIHEIPLEGQDSEKRAKILKPFVSMFSDRLSESGFSKTKTVRYEMDVVLDKESTRQVFELQAAARPKERIGFVMRGESSVRWADKYVLRYERDIEVPQGEMVFRAADLLAQFPR